MKLLILPLFAFADCGIPLDGFAAAKLAEPLPLGIAGGLFLGKPIGITLACVIVVKLRVTALPEGFNWLHIAGVGFLVGIGFTMSLFIGGLAFESADLQASVRVGVVVGSVISTVIGVAILFTAAGRQRA